MSIARGLALILLVGTTIGCDRITKHFAAETLSGAPRQSFLADTVRLEYAENSGAFLSVGARWPSAVRTALFTIGPGLMVILAVAAAIRYRWSGGALLGLSLFAAGGMSNIADRVMHGRVIDFMNVGWGPLRTGIFNVADVAVLLGAVLLLCAELRDQGYLLRR